MKKIYLEVPFEQEDIVKKLGSKWDKEKKQWYIPENVDPLTLDRWMPDDDYNMRADYFYFARSHKECYKCGEKTKVYAIILPEGFEEIDDIAMDEMELRGKRAEQPIFCARDYISMISYVTYISSEALNEIHKVTNLYSKEYSNFVGYSYYRSLCEFCSTSQGDNYTIEEMGSPFSPREFTDIKDIKLDKISTAIKVNSGVGSMGYMPGEYILGMI